VIIASMGHAGVGIGAEAYRWVLIDVGADPKAPVLKGEKQQLEVLRRYGSTILRFGASLHRGETPLVPRALLVDLDPRSANLILQSYPKLFAMKDKHAVYGLGGAARNWAEGRTRFKKEIEQKQDLASRIRGVSPEPVRGFILPFSMGGGTGGSFSSEFMRYMKEEETLGQATIATFATIPEFGWDPVIHGASHISIVMSLAHQIKYSDTPILMENGEMRKQATRFADRLRGRSSIVDELPRQIQVGWRDYRDMNLLAAHAIAEFMNSFIRETEWDMSNFRTWLAAGKPKFVVPWLIPLVPRGGSTMDSIERNIADGNQGILFDLAPEGEKVEPGPRDSACIIVKTKGSITAEQREYFKRFIEEKFEIPDKRLVFIKVPALEGEPASACILLNVKAIGKKILPLVAEAEDAWESYKDEYQKRGLSHEEFKQAVIDVTGHLG
jgi:tubulin gamma